MTIEATRALQRAVALLRGGTPTSRVWRVLADDPDAPAVCAEVADRIAQGHDAGSALSLIDAEEWRLVGAAWRVAELSGAPMAFALDRLCKALQGLQRLAERRSVLLAGPRATIRLVASLPPLALVMGFILGFDPVGVLLSPLGAVLAGVGGVLLVTGIWWANAMTTQLARAAWVAGFEFELSWIALTGGSAPVDAVRRVVDCVDSARATWVPLSAFRRDGQLWRAIAAASTQGTSVSTVLLAEAEAARARARAELERAAERLAVKVLMPLALCVLPSFVVLGVLPVLFAVMGSLGASVS